MRHFASFVYLLLLVAILCSLIPLTQAIAYGWGKNDNAQLGLGHKNSVYAPTLIPFYNSIPLLHCITATSYHICIAQNSSSYAGGLQYFGQFATGTTSTTAYPTPVACPSLNSSLDISCAGTSCNANLKTNLLGWGNYAGYVQGKTTGSFPKIQTALPTYQFDGKVVGVYSVQEGSIVQLSNGTVFVAGINGAGRLGNGNTATTYTYVEATFWRSVTLKKIFSSQSAHVCGLATNGSLYCWGQNNMGQCGVSGASYFTTPVKVGFFDDNFLQVYKVSYGDSHTVVLTCGGRVFTFGACTYGQLGTLGVQDQNPHPNPLEATHPNWNNNIADIVTGIYQTMCRTTTGDWYVWGGGTSGSLATNNSNDIFTPSYNGLLSKFNRIKSSSQSTNFFAWYDSSVTNDKLGCTLLNECVTGHNNCSVYATCTDLERGYSCQCQNGYTGDGITCIDAYSCQVIGYQCVPESFCDDSSGVAVCACPNGYQGDGRINNGSINGTGCTDINECLGNPCASFAYCTNLPGSYTCTCNNGFYGDAYISGCTVTCSAGQYAYNASSCADCQPGTYSDNGQATYCMPCPAGTYTDQYGTNSSSNCKRCPTGGYSSYGASFCKLCDYGYTNDPTELNTDNSTCFGCPLGTYGYYGVCYACNTGQYAVEAVAKQCLYCPPGTYNTQTGSLYCLQCPAGYVSPGGVSSCSSCPAGYYSTAGTKDCLKCPPGTSTNGKSGQNSCAPCAPGSYASKSIAASCTLCPAGTYSNTSGASYCTRCPQGSFANAQGSTQCTTCASNTFLAATAGSSCYACAAGSATTDGVNCIPCNAGNYWDSSTGTCKPCAAGTFVAVSGSSVCYACNDGSYTSSTGSAYCKRCDVNTYSNSTTGYKTCTACPSGKSSAGGASSCS